ncbi:hypothetical protein ACLOJK_003942 [Asimina triloba]
MSGGGTQHSLRKALGAIKDSTTVGLAKVNSDYKELDVAIVKATNHVERPAKDKHIRAIFAAISATRPRADVAYCIHALARRLAKTHNWAVALKTLIVIHRALREVDPTFREELINYGRSRSHMLNLAHFKDDSSPNAWDYSAWVRTYALFLEERLECFRVLKYDVETDRPRTRELDTPELLEQLPALQQLLSRLIACQVAVESIKIYNAINDGTINLVDKFFEMQRHDAIKALEIYRKAGQQAERLSEFYEICKNLDIGRGEKFVKIEQPPASFLTAMEEYVKDDPRASSVHKDQVLEERSSPSKVVLPIEYKKVPEVQEEPKTPSLPPKPVKVEVPAPETPDLLGLNEPSPVASELDEKNALALAIVPADNSSNGVASAGPDLSNGTTGWELALVTAPSSNESATAASKLWPYIWVVFYTSDPIYDADLVLILGCQMCNHLGICDAMVIDDSDRLQFHLSVMSQVNAPGRKLYNRHYSCWIGCVTQDEGIDRRAVGLERMKLETTISAGGLDKLTLDSLYDDALRRANQSASYNPWEPMPAAGPMVQQMPHDPFYASNAVSAPAAVQMAAMAGQQQAFMFQQQPVMMMGQQPQQPASNPFGNPHGAGVNPYGAGMPVQTYNPYTGLI